MKIMIDNAVPLNNGDAALIFAVGDLLETLGHTVTYSCYNYKKVKKKYPEKNWIPTILSNRWLNKLPVISKIYYELAILLSPKIKNQDLFISAPGGYINSYYGFENKLRVFSLYKKRVKKPIIMFSQSIGPLTQSDEHVLKKYSAEFSAFLVRDDLSFNRMSALTTGTNIVQTYDAAFLLPLKGNQQRTATKRIAISVRKWTHDNRDERVYFELIQTITQKAVEQGYEVEFLSTCQGVPSYVDDSITAEKIVQHFPNNVKEHVCVDSNDYTLDELQEKLTQFDFVIGTRLHMCILSWISGTPAFNISYEEKGKECYKYMDMSDYTLDYNENTQIVDKIEHFLRMDEQEKKDHFHKIEKIQQEMFSVVNEILESDVK